MDFKQIQTFVALAETLHFGHAAQQLGIAQPHVSRRIKRLEEDLEARLFHRDKRNVRLTEAGEVLLAEARVLLRDAQRAKEHVRESAQGRRGRLKVSLVTSAMLGVLPSILEEFRRGNPEVHLSFQELASGTQLDALRHSIADVAFLHPPMRVPDGLDQLVLERNRLVAVLPNNHRLAQRPSIDLRELATEPWIMMPRAESAPIHDRVIAVCRRSGVTPRVVHEAGHIYARLGLVAAGFGVHLLHNAWQKVPFPGVVYVPFEPSATIRLACYWRRRDPNPMLRGFLDVVRRRRGQGQGDPLPAGLDP